MNNIKKIGLTALAGSLVTSAAYAGALDVSGSAKITYKSQDETEVTGNSFSTGKGITFSGSGELENGFTMSYGYTMTDAAFSSTSVNIDMGDAGTIGVSNSAGQAGLPAYDSVIPTAGEEVWDDVDADDNGIVTHSKVNSVDYMGSFAGVGISAAYVNNGSGDSSDSSIVFTYSPMDGMEVGYGTGEDGKSLDLMTAFAKYTYNNVTLAYQMSELDNAGSTADEESDAYGISLAVNENLSVSLGRHEVDMGAGNEDEESSGISASYTTGGMTITAIANSTDSVAGSANSDDSYKEITVAFAF